MQEKNYAPIYRHQFEWWDSWCSTYFWNKRHRFLFLFVYSHLPASFLNARANTAIVTCIDSIFLHFPWLHFNWIIHKIPYRTTQQNGNPWYPSCSKLERDFQRQLLFSISFCRFFLLYTYFSLKKHTHTCAHTHKQKLSIAFCDFHQFGVSNLSFKSIGTTWKWKKLSYRSWSTWKLVCFIPFCIDDSIVDVPLIKQYTHSTFKSKSELVASLLLNAIVLIELIVDIRCDWMWFLALFFDNRQYLWEKLFAPKPVTHKYWQIKASVEFSGEDKKCIPTSEYRFGKYEKLHSKCGTSDTFSLLCMQANDRISFGERGCTPDCK